MASEKKVVCDAIEEIWQTVADMVVEFKNKKVPIPHIVNTSLQGARTLINLCKSHSKLAHDIKPSAISAVQGMCINCCGADIVARIECELHSIEDMTIPKAVNTGFNDEYIMQWQNRISEHWIELGKTKQTTNQYAKGWKSARHLSK